MSNFTPPNYREIERKEWVENASNVVKELDDRDTFLFKRISSFVNHSKYSREQVEDKIREDPMFAACFAKAPGRTLLHRDIDLEWLMKHLNVPINILSKTGSMYCITGTGKIEVFETNYKYRPSRPLDFSFETYGHKFYIARIYAHESGGGQDRGYRELQQLLNNFKNAEKDTNVVLIVIANGVFYNDDRMAELRNLTRESDPKSYAVHIEEVPDILEQYKR